MMPGVFVLSLVLLAVDPSDRDMVLPIVAYESKEVCDKKLEVINEQLVFKNPVINLECYPWENFNKKEKEKEEPKKDGGQDI